ncbi:MAG: hypothetical protein HRT61_21475, partial [Ekhidna sp.]|nr:hypothetical protein [Ekhidna sp.]
ACLDWVEVTAALNSRTEGGTSVRKVHEIQEEAWGTTSELLKKSRSYDEEEIADMTNLFWEMHFMRKPTGTPLLEPFDPVRMEAHFRLTGRIISSWEYTLLIEMDLGHRATVIEYSKGAK